MSTIPIIFNGLYYPNGLGNPSAPVPVGYADFTTKGFTTFSLFPTPAAFGRGTAYAIDTDTTYECDGVSYTPMDKAKVFSSFSNFPVPSTFGNGTAIALDTKLTYRSDPINNIWRLQGFNPSTIAKTFIAFGDSRVANGYSGGYLYGRGWMNHLQYALNGRLLQIRNAGIAGNTTTQMLARIQTDVVAYAPDWCLRMASANDFGLGIPVSTTIANVTAIYNLLTAAGIKFATATLGPWSLFTTYDQLNSRTVYNNWIKWFGVQNNFPVIDEFAAVGNPANDLIANSNMVYDGNHYSDYGASLVAGEWFKVFDKILPPSCVLNRQATDYDNLLARPASDFVVGSTLPTGWLDYSTAGTFSHSVVARTDGIQGNLVSVTGTASAQAQTIGFQLPGANRNIARLNSHTYPVGYQIIAPDGNLYRCTVQGTSAASAPTFDPVVGHLTTDGGATFQRIENFNAGDVVYYECEIFVSGVSGGNGVSPAFFMNGDGGGSIRVGNLTDQNTKVPNLINGSMYLRSNDFTLLSTNTYFTPYIYAYLDNGVTATLSVNQPSLKHSTPPLS